MIHIAGTNGKGSTVAYLRSILIEAGVNVGSFTSPYIEEFNERIAIDAKPIPDNQLIQYVKNISQLLLNLIKTQLLAGLRNLRF